MIRLRVPFKGWLARTYLTIDPRSLATGRISLSLVLLLDLLRRVPGITLWYSNQGLMPNHTALWRPPFPHTFSFFFIASWPNEAALGFVLCDYQTFLGAGGDLVDPLIAGTSYTSGNELNEEKWIDDNSSQMIINRYNATLTQAD